MPEQNEDLINAQLLFEMFDKEIKKRNTLVFTSEESKWYTRLQRQLLNNRLEAITNQTEKL